MARKGEQVFGYVTPIVKERIKRIKEKDGRTESWVINKCLEIAIETLEKQVGISEPGHGPRRGKASA